MQTRAFARNQPISLKNSVVVCSLIRNKPLSKAKKILEDLLEKKRSINGKYYTKTVKVMLEILKAAEANAKQKNMKEEKLFVKIAKADKGQTLYSFPSKKAKFARRKRKSTNITIVLEER